MPELRDDTTEDGFHEIQFTRKQLVFLFMTMSLVLILVFLLGVLLGRGVTSNGGDESIGFDASAGAPASDPRDPAPPIEPPAPPKEGTLAYPELLAGSDQKLKPTEKEEKEEPKPVEPPVAKPVEPPSAAAKPPGAAPAEGAGTTVPTSARPGTWVIQVSALKTRPPAAAWVQRLITKGYPAFLENPAPGVFRVRVGRFKDRREAEQVARRLQKEEQLTPVISR